MDWYNRDVRRGKVISIRGGNMKKSLFPQDQLDSPENYDLCVKVNGVYLDAMRNDRTELWSVHWNNHKVADGLVSRDDAIKWCKENIKDLKRGKVEYLNY